MGCFICKFCVHHTSTLTRTSAVSDPFLPLLLPFASHAQHPFETLRSAKIRLATAALGLCGDDAYSVPQIRALNDRVGELEATNLVLSTDLDIARAENSVLHGNLKAAEDKHSNTAAELTHMTASHANATGEVARLETLAKDRESELGQAKGVCSDLEGTVSAQYEEIKSLLSNGNAQTQLSELSGKLKAKEKECARYETTVGELVLETTQQAQEIKLLSASNTEAQAEILGLKTGLDMAEMELKGTGAKVTLSRAHTQALRDECANKTKTILALESAASLSADNLAAYESVLTKSTSITPQVLLAIMNTQGNKTPLTRESLDALVEESVAQILADFAPFLPVFPSASQVSLDLSTSLRRAGSVYAQLSLTRLQRNFHGKMRYMAEKYGRDWLWPGYTFLPEEISDLTPWKNFIPAY